MKTSAQWILLLVLAIGICICCPASGVSQTSDPPMFTVPEYPRTDGSISTQPLSTLIACRLTNTSFESCRFWHDWTRTLYPTTDLYESDKRFSLNGKSGCSDLKKKIESNLWNKIRHSNTHPSYVNLIERKVELIIAAREPSDDELALARQNRVEIKTLPIARDALAFIVSSLNSVESLSIEQIRNIYTGKFTSWADLGWQEDRIHPYRRNRNSGSEEKMQKLVMKGSPTLSGLLPLDVNTLACMSCPSNALTRDQHGIAYTPYYYGTYMANFSVVKMVAVNNVMPSHETIKNGTYPLVTEVVVAYLSDLPKDSSAAKIRDWLLTVDGQKVVAESGYVPIKE